MSKESQEHPGESRGHDPPFFSSLVRKDHRYTRLQWGITAPFPAWDFGVIWLTYGCPKYPIFGSSRRIIQQSVSSALTLKRCTFRSDPGRERPVRTWKFTTILFYSILFDLYRSVLFYSSIISRILFYSVLFYSTVRVCNS